MKKLIALLVLTCVFGCTNEDSSQKYVTGKWSTESFELYVYAEKRLTRWDDINKKWIYTEKQYDKDERWYYDKNGSFKNDNTPVFWWGLGSYLYVKQNQDKIMNLILSKDQKVIQDYFDFTIDKEIKHYYRDFDGSWGSYPPSIYYYR